MSTAVIGATGRVGSEIVRGILARGDAVAIVVSEETGIVSIVVDGRIERGLDSDQLRAQLRALVLQRREKPAKREEVEYT